MFRRSLMLLLSLSVAAGCSSESDFDRYRTLRAPLEAWCTANVKGTGNVDIETDYLAHVVQCENGSAPLEALKAQAVAARSYLYYKLDTAGSIADGTSDQVFSCGATPKAIHHQAVAETSGQVLRYNNTQVAAFYVAGAVPGAANCVAKPGDNDYSNTEHYVTYNQGKSGSALTQTTLGWVHPENWANRGCKSQNGAACLANKGWGYEDIVRFYYGEDINLVQTTGSCVDPPEDTGEDTGTDTGEDTGTDTGEDTGDPPVGDTCGELVVAGAPAGLAAGASGTVTLVVHNASGPAWPAGSVRLEADGTLYSSEWDGSTVPAVILEAVAPSGELLVEFPITAPDQPGEASDTFRLVHADTGPFDCPLSAVLITIDVTQGLDPGDTDDGDTGTDGGTDGSDDDPDTGDDPDSRTDDPVDLSPFSGEDGDSGTRRLRSSAGCRSAPASGTAPPPAWLLVTAPLGILALRRRSARPAPL